MYKVSYFGLHLLQVRNRNFVHCVSFIQVINNNIKKFKHGIIICRYNMNDVRRQVRKFVYVKTASTNKPRSVFQSTSVTENNHLCVLLSSYVKVAVLLLLILPLLCKYGLGQPILLLTNQGIITVAPNKYFNCL